MGFYQSTPSAWFLSVEEEPRLGDLRSGVQPLLRDSFHMWLWVNLFPLWTSDSPSSK